MFFFHFYPNACLLLNAAPGNGQTSAKGLGSLQEKEPDQLLRCWEPFHATQRHPRKNRATLHQHVQPRSGPSAAGKLPARRLRQTQPQRDTEGRRFLSSCSPCTILSFYGISAWQLPTCRLLFPRAWHHTRRPRCVPAHSAASDRVLALLQASSLYHTPVGCQ